MRGKQVARGALGVVLVATVIVACGPNEGVRRESGPLPRPALEGPPGRQNPATSLSGELIQGVDAAVVSRSTPLGTSPEFSSRGAVLAAPPVPRRRPLPPDAACPGLADPGFTARCGLARNGTGDLVWLVQTRVEGKGYRIALLRPAGTEADVVLEATDETGTRFDNIRVAVADVSGDGGDDISFAFYRKGTGQVLSLDLVQAPGLVALHRDYVQGSARASAGRLETWESVHDRITGKALLLHETIQWRDGGWRRTSRVGTASAAVFGQDFADPFVLRAGDRYYAYSTNRGPWNVPVISSRDLRDWRPVGDALPQLPPWSVRGRVWAPSVLPRQSGAGGPNAATSYVLYYTTRHEASGRQCISAAHGASPEGPFVDRSAAPLICQFEDGGSIDPSPYVDRDGSAYLLWKSEDRGHTIPARIWSQPLSPDGLSLTGTPVPILTQDKDWERPTMEGPSMVRDGDRLFLFYSAGTWHNSTYAVGYAECASPAGPCSKRADRPLLSSRRDVSGPGGQEILQDATGHTWLAYHAWVPFEGGYPGGGRRLLHISPLRFDDSIPVLDGRPAVRAFRDE